MKTKLALFVFLGFLLLISASCAKEYDVSVSIYPKEATANPCGVATFDINIINLGEKEDTFSVSVEGLPEDWYTLSEDSVTLEPEDGDKVYLFVTPYCFGEVGTFEASVLVTDQSNDTDSFTLEVVTDHKIEISLPREVKTCLQETSETEATIKNTGASVEDLVFEISGNASDFVSLREESYVLGVDEEKEITIEINPIDVVIGDYVLELEAKSTNSYATSKDSILIKIMDCYEVSVLYPEEVETCVNEPVQFEITVENTGLKKDSYALEIERLNITETVELNSDESSTLKMLFLKDQPGTYYMNFLVESDYVSSEGTIEFLVVKCYDVELIMEEEQLKIEPGKGKLVTVKVINLGTREDTYDMLSNVDWVSIKPPSITLKSNGSEEVYVYYSPEFGMKGVFNTTLTAKSKNSEDVVGLRILVSEVTIPIIETTTTTVSEIPTAEIIGIFESIMGNKALRSLLIAIIVVIIILIAIYLVVMR
jgi:uncharacterized membrane protein